MPINGTRTYSFYCNSVTDASGFITMANSRFLKRDVVKNGVRQFCSFFPIGPNIAWYSCVDYWTFSQPRGIYEYERYIDSLDGNANYMRIWLNRYQYLSLYGPEYTQTENNSPKVYFDSIVNQKDSAELDHIISYASQHGIAVMPCVFSGDFRYINDQEPSDPSVWGNNPFNSILHLENPCDFFNDPEATKITKNLLRYIISRWGYATNIVCWELWNEVDFVADMCPNCTNINGNIVAWHNTIADYIRVKDPFDHCVSSSIGRVDGNPLFSSIPLYQNLDIVQQHNYQDIQRARSRFEIPNALYTRTNQCHSTYPSKPAFMGEFGFSLVDLAIEKDPKGVSLHNSLWASLFSAPIGPASFWWWYYLDATGTYNRFTPLLNFCQNLPILSGTFSAHRTGTEQSNNELVFPNGLETYYMIDATEEYIMGWCQDSAFAYQALRRLTDSIRLHNDTLFDGTILPANYFVDDVPYDTNGYVYTLNPSIRPGPSSSTNTITLPITNQPIGTMYKVKWYNPETGFVFNTGTIGYAWIQQDAQENKFISFDFPSYIRNLQGHTINNTFGDAVFILTIYNINKLNKNE